MSFADTPKFKTKPPSGLPADSMAHHAFVIVGAGPAGLVLALEMARKGHKVTLVTALDFIAHGSKAICFARQSLNILDRLDVGERVLEKGVTWNVGKLFWRDSDVPLYQFDMLPVKDQKNPGFVNIQQYYVEDYLVDALEAMDNVDIRWGHSVTHIALHDHAVATLEIHCAEGAYKLTADYVLACDGFRSAIRQIMGLDFEGRVFEDNFLIADVIFEQQRPSERWFWFDPPFCPGGTALLHKQPDNVWRLDFQLGRDIDRNQAVRPENVEPYVKGMLGEGIAFKKAWYSVYTFQCRRMTRFVHGPVIFVGDSAHLVSPFGARGANGGLADAENIAWKLDRVLRGVAPSTLIESYNYERVMGADENIRNSSRTTDFMTPPNAGARAFRDAVLELSETQAFARPFINSGRLYNATPYHNSPLSTPDDVAWSGGIAPGHCCLDAPLADGWLLTALGNDFTLLCFEKPSAVHPADKLPTKLTIVSVPCHSQAAKHYDCLNGGYYLVRPDQVVAARWKSYDAARIAAALKRAQGEESNGRHPDTS